LKLINKLENPDAKFDLYFLAYDSPQAVSHGNHWTDREGIVELTHNYGTENDPDYKIANGNSEPARGFGHLAISVDNIQAACQRIDDAGYKFQKKLTDGKMRHIAFALDPDGYWVEVIGQKPLEETESVKETDITTYKLVRFIPEDITTPLLTGAEPHYDSRQRCRSVPQVLPGDNGYEALQDK
jgi:lactoylglutathione lyase